MISFTQNSYSSHLFDSPNFYLVLAYISNRSKFFDSNWILFGIETILVLVVCNTAAFCVGSFLSSLISADGDTNLFSNS